MTDTISLTLPMQAKALLRASEMLTGMARDLDPALVIQSAPEKPKVSAAEAEQLGIVPPLAPAPAPTVDPGAPELDANGLPWDERIHSGTKSTLQDGSWKKKRNVDPNEVLAVEAELRASSAAPAETPAAAAFGSAPAAAPTPTTATPPPPAPPAPAPAPANPAAWPTFLQRITLAMQNGSKTKVDIDNACAQVGLAGFAMLGTRHDLIPVVEALIWPEGVPQ